MVALAVLIVVVGSMLAGSPRAEAPPGITHVFLLMLENKSYHETFGPGSKAPYLARTLPSLGALVPNYYAIGHLSLDNYIALVSGQAPNPQTQADCHLFTEFLPGTIGRDGQAIGHGCVYPRAVKTLANQLEARGLGWRGYMEDMKQPCRHPAIGARDSTQSARPGDQYAARHNPFVYFHAVIDFPTCRASDVDYSRLARDVASPATTPAFAFITPNLCDDGHDEPCVDGRPGGLVQIDRWLRANVPPLLDSPGFRDGGLLIVTFDEAEAGPASGDASACCNEHPGPNTPNPGGPIPGPGGGRIGAVLVSPFIRPGTRTNQSYNHYSLLRTVEDVLGLGHLGYAGQRGLRALGSDVFTASSAPRPVRVPRVRLRVRPRTLHRNRLPATLRARTARHAIVRLRGACPRARRRADARGRARFAIRRLRHHRRYCRVIARRTGFRAHVVRVRVRR